MNIFINNETEYDLSNYYEIVRNAVNAALTAVRAISDVEPEKRLKAPCVSSEHMAAFEGIPDGISTSGEINEVSVTFVSCEDIQKMNRQYRGIDAVTDVLSFPLDGPMLGDIVICFDRACSQAREYGNTARREIAFLAVHGTLHLLGYDHMEPADETAMIKLQKEIMRNLP